MNRYAKLLLFVTLLVLAFQVFAQSIPVSTPRLPPRNDGPAAASPQQPGAPSSGQFASQPAAPTGAYAGANPQVGAYSSFTPQGAGQAPYGMTAAPPEPSVTPPQAEAGTCRVQPTPDRQTMMLVSGTKALARAHVALGEFRAQQVVHSPDGRWAVAYTKLRGAAVFAAMTIDLERCEVERTIELSAAGEDVSFDGDEAVLRLSGGERRVNLRDGRVR